MESVCVRSVVGQHGSHGVLQLVIITGDIGVKYIVQSARGGRTGIVAPE